VATAASHTLARAALGVVLMKLSSPFLPFNLPTYLDSLHYGDPGFPRYLFPAESPPVLSNPRWHLCLSGRTRDDTFRAEKVSWILPLVSFGGLSTAGRVTTFSLLYMHNLRLPLFAQYDMPEKYDLARESITPLITGAY